MTMKVSVSNKLSKYLKDSKSIKSAYGNISGRIETALSVLGVADNLEEVPNVPPTRRHKLTGNYQGCWAIDLDKSYRMIIKPTMAEEDVSKITSIEIIDIVDYH